MLLSFLKLIRYQDLLIIIITQVLIKYALFDSFAVEITLSTFGFFLLCLSSVSIAASGHIINAIHEAPTGRINKSEKQVPSSGISEKTAHNAYIIFTVTGVGIGFYLSNLIGRPGFSALFIIISALLYLYATHLKYMMVAGNLLIAVVVSMVVIIMGLFELLPAITLENRQTQSIIFSILLDYALYAFLLNWLREMVKDQRDIKKDYNLGKNTLPIALGKERANKAIFIIGLLPVVALIYYMYTYLFTNLYAVLYTLILVLGPLLFFQSVILTAKTRDHYHRLSLLLKIIMVTALASIGLYPLILL